MGPSSRPRGVVAVAALAAVLAVPREASALDPAETWGKTSLLGGLRFGTNSARLGIGFRGGHTLKQGVYIGGMFDYFFGRTFRSSFPGLDTDTTFRLLTVAAEGGFDFRVTEKFMVRPFGGIGVGRAIGEVCGRRPNQTVICNDASDTNPLFHVGGLANYVSGHFMAGGELRVMFSEEAFFVIGGHAGGVF
jgi:hypothetical protein